MVFSILFFAGISWSALSVAQGDEIRIVPLENKESRDQEFCRTEKPNTVFPCEAPYSKALLIYAPLSLAQIVNRHIAEAFRQGFYRTLAYQDLFHGHLILKGPQLEYSSPVTFFSDTTAVLYHSAEKNSRWYKEGQEGISLENRTPRSYVGWLNGSIKTALSIVKELIYKKTYEDSGTIYTDEIVRAHPELTDHKVEKMGGYPKITLKTQEGKTCKLSTQMIILPEPQGRFKTPDGTPYDITVRCTNR